MLRIIPTTVGATGRSTIALSTKEGLLKHWQTRIAGAADTSRKHADFEQPLSIQNIQHPQCNTLITPQSIWAAHTFPSATRYVARAALESDTTMLLGPLRPQPINALVINTKQALMLKRKFGTSAEPQAIQGNPVAYILSDGIQYKSLLWYWLSLKVSDVGTV